MKDEVYQPLVKNFVESKMVRDATAMVSRDSLYQKFFEYSVVYDTPPCGRNQFFRLLRIAIPHLQSTSRRLDDGTRLNFIPGWRI